MTDLVDGRAGVEPLQESSRKGCNAQCKRARCCAMHTSDLIQSAEAASILGVDRSTLSRWVDAGKVQPALRGEGQNGPLFFRRSDIEAYASRRAEAAS